MATMYRPVHVVTHSIPNATFLSLMKTFVYSLLLVNAIIHSECDIAIAVASGGLEALLMPNGGRARSLSGMPIPKETHTHRR